MAFGINLGIVHYLRTCTSLRFPTTTKYSTPSSPKGTQFNRDRAASRNSTGIRVLTAINICSASNSSLSPLASLMIGSSYVCPVKLRFVHCIFYMLSLSIIAPLICMKNCLRVCLISLLSGSFPSLFFFVRILTSPLLLFC